MGKVNKDEGGMMNEIKKLATQILIKNGFSDAIPINERMYQVRYAENILLVFWVFFAISFLRKLTDILIWFVGVVLCLIIEQVVAVFYLWIRHNWKRNTGSIRASTSFFQSTRRSIYKRVNFLFFVIFFLAQVLFLPVGIATTPISGFWYGGILVALMIIPVENYIDEKKKNHISLPMIIVSLGSVLFTGWRQVVSITNQRITLAISGVFLAVVLGSISEDFWFLISQISWVNLTIIIIILFLIALFPSFINIDHSIEHEISCLSLIENPFSSEKLFHSFIRLSPYDEARKLSHARFDEYKTEYSWKLKRLIYKSVLGKLINEMKIRAKWQFWISSVGLAPLIFVFIVSLSLILFPSDVLAKWTEKPIPYQFFRLLSNPFGMNAFGISINFWADPILKFSAVLTFLVLAYFANNYSQDSKRIFENLHVDESFINDLIVVLCGYSVLTEIGYQLVGSFYTPVGKQNQSLLFPAPIILIPNGTEKDYVEKLIEPIQEAFNFEGRLICAAFLPQEAFLNTTLAVVMKVFDTEVSLQMSEEEKHSRCWVWLDKGDNTTGLYKFDHLEVAIEWAEKNTMGGTV